jgi:hypothetical protein
MDNGTAMGTASLVNSTATITETPPGVGNYAISATYNGGGNFAGSNTEVGPNSIITTVAGEGDFGFSGDNGPATAAVLDNPNGVAVDSAGDLFIADSSNNRIREVNHLTGMITTVAGNGTEGFSGDNGPATAAELNDPYGVAVDSAGDLFIADFRNDRIREVNHLTGIITTVAGDGGWGGSIGDNGPATAAILGAPTGVAVDSNGNLYIADNNLSRVREVNLSSGIITTVAGNGTWGYSGDNGPATAAGLDGCGGIAVDSFGNLFIAGVDDLICEVNHSSGIISTVAGNGIWGYSGDGGQATAAPLCDPSSVAVDSAGDLFILDTYYNLIREVNLSTGIINTMAGGGSNGLGDGGPATAAELNAYAFGLAVDSAGNLFIPDNGDGRIREVASGNLMLAVTPAPLTVTGVTANSKTYDGTTTATLDTGGASLSGVLPGDSIALNTSNATATFENADAGNGIPLRVTGFTISGAQAGDYTLTQPSFTENILPAPLTITAYDTSKTYGTADPPFYACYSGFVPGEGPGNLGGTLVFTTNEPTSGYAPAGVYQVTPSGLISNNYAITFDSGTLTVQAVPLTVTGVTANNKVYDGTTAATLDASGAALHGVLPGDSVSLPSGTGTFATVDAGNDIAVSVTELSLSGPQASDYTLTLPTGLTADITAAPLTITADDQSMFYDTTVPDLAASYSGFVNGETSGSLNTLPTLTTTATATSPLSTYPITASGAVDPNYNITYVGGTLTVLPATPTANGDNYRTAPNNTLAVTADQGVLANDSDPNGFALSASLVSGPADGTLSLNSDGSFSYTPNTGFRGADSFTYRDFDGAIYSNVATVSIVVNTAPPVAIDQTYQLNQDTPLTVGAQSGLLTGDTDADSALLTAALVSSPADGTVSVNADGSFSYTPNAGYSGPDSFTYEANDGVQNSNAANVVLWINQPPTAVGLSNSALSDNQPAGSVVGLIATNDANTGDTFSYSLVFGDGSNDNGLFTIVGNQLQTNAVLDYATQSTYSVRIRSTASDGLWVEDPLTVTVSPPSSAAPSAPTNLAAASASTSAVDLSWSVDGTGTSYTVQRGSLGSNAAAEYVLATVDDGQTSGQTVLTITEPSGAAAGGYLVLDFTMPDGSTWQTGQIDSALDNVDECFSNAPTSSPFSSESSSSAAGVTTITLGGAIEDAYMDDSQVDYGIVWTTLPACSDPVLNDSGLTPDTVYYYRVSAANAAGGSGYSTMIQAATLPVAPTNLTVTAISSTQVSLSWQDNSGGQDGFSVEQMIDGQWQSIDTVAAGTTSDTVTGLSFEPSSSYSFCVEALSETSGASSLPAGAATMTTAACPAAPSGLTATVVSAGDTELTWTAGSANTSGYEIYRSTDDSTWVPLVVVGAGATQYNDTTTSETSQYYYQIVAANSAGASLPDATSDPTEWEPPVLQLNGPATIDEGQAAVIQMSAAFEGTETVNAWVVHWGDGTQNTVQSNTASHLYTSGSGTYNVSVVADTAEGQFACPDTVSVGVSPSAPSGLSASPIDGSSSEIQLSWSRGSQIATGYRIEQSTDGINYTLVATVGTQGQYIVTNLTPATPYYFRVCTTNDAGRSDYATATGTIPSNAPGLPVASIAANAGCIIEGEEVAIGVGLSSYATQNVVVDYQVCDGTATAGQDYTDVTAGQVMIPAGSNFGTIEIATHVDLENTWEMSFSVSLTAASGASIDPAANTCVVTIPDWYPYMHVVSGDSEAAGSVLNFTLCLPNFDLNSSGDTVVDYTTVDGTAVADRDYASSSGSVTIQGNVAFVSIPTFADASNVNQTRSFTLDYWNADAPDPPPVWALFQEPGDIIGDQVAGSLGLCDSEGNPLPHPAGTVSNGVLSIPAPGTTGTPAELTVNGFAQNPAGGEFALDFDSSKVSIYKNAGCTDPVTSGDPEIDDTANTTLYMVAAAASETTNDIRIKLDYNGNVLDTVYETAIQKLGLTAYRTGGNYGVPVSQADQQSGDPSNYVILVDDGYTQDPTGTLDDIDYNTNLINSDQPVNVRNQNFARITLNQLACPTGDNGTISLTLSSSSSVRLFDGSGYELTAADLNTTVGGSGYLAGLATGNVEIYVEGLQANSDFTLSYRYVTGGGLAQNSASIHIAIADISFVNDEGETLDGVFENEQLSELPTSVSPGTPLSEDQLTAMESLSWDEFRNEIAGLTPGEIGKVTFTSSAGGSYTEQLTDPAGTTESADFQMLFDDGGQALSTGEDSDLLSAYGLDALGVPAAGNMASVTVTTVGGDSFTDKIPVVRAWVTNASPAWTSTYAFAFAGANHAQLAELAYDITGNPSDASLLGPPYNVAEVTQGIAVDVTPLLSELSGRVRDAAVAAAHSPIAFKNATFGVSQSLATMDAAQINALFEMPLASKPSFLCNQMVEVIYCRALITGALLSDAQFDKLNINPGNIFPGYTTPLGATTVDQLQPGDWAVFYNAPNIPASEFYWRAENVIKTESDSYFGWNIGELSYMEWKTELKEKFNEGVTSSYQWYFRPFYYVRLVSSVPGYTDQSYFLNVPVLAQMIFQSKTGQTL